MTAITQFGNDWHLSPDGLAMKRNAMPDTSESPETEKSDVEKKYDHARGLVIGCGLFLRNEGHIDNLCWYSNRIKVMEAIRDFLGDDYKDEIVNSFLGF